MPPKTKITREMVIEAAFTIARQAGADNINARMVAKKLGCSTQPVMSQFPRIEELKRAAFDRTNEFHTEYLLQAVEGEDPLLSIGLNYLRFAAEESNLFRFLFQSGYAVENSIPDIVDSEDAAPIVDAMREATRLNAEDARQLFFTLSMFVHGYASLLANNALEFDVQTAKQQLEIAYNGAFLVLQEESHD